MPETETGFTFWRGGRWGRCNVCGHRVFCSELDQRTAFIVRHLETCQPAQEPWPLMLTADRLATHRAEISPWPFVIAAVLIVVFVAIWWPL